MQKKNEQSKTIKIHAPSLSLSHTLPVSPTILKILRKLWLCMYTLDEFEMFSTDVYKSSRCTLSRIYPVHDFYYDFLLILRQFCFFLDKRVRVGDLEAKFNFTSSAYFHHSHWIPLSNRSLNGYNWIFMRFSIWMFFIEHIKWLCETNTESAVFDMGNWKIHTHKMHLSLSIHDTSLRRILFFNTSGSFELVGKNCTLMK